ncbi:hypothetical protein [Methanogenium cariaci]|uniref:hypothetical protein n=1 Tax=Methanogenium cariaci TaxID=2197 RepID=UPI001FE19C7D|nr:hypothetical protein [Methanogenium cariaci]
MFKEGALYGFGTPDEVLREEVIKEVYGIETRIFHDGDCPPYIIPLRPVSHDCTEE